MKLKELLNITNYSNQVHIHFENKDRDNVILIYKGNAENAIKYFGEATLNFQVEFVNLGTDHETKAPIMHIVIR